MKHGGDLADAEANFGAPSKVWLDLSTGISPLPFPFRLPSGLAWQQLPQANRLTALLRIARRAYAAPGDAPIVAAPGTQALIQLLPLVCPARRVAIVGPTYTEHALCWREAGAEVRTVNELDDELDADVVVVVNPNNPDGRCWRPSRILASAEALGRRGGLLIVDEAFADVLPEASVASSAGMGALIVLRSFGKFFGLAGLRLGFALGPSAIIERLETLLGPWAVSGPAIEIGAEALSDLSWQARTRDMLHELAIDLDSTLAEAGLTVVGGTDLYRLVAHPAAQRIHAGLAGQGIWVRRFDNAPDWLRFGLPAGRAEHARLAQGLRACKFGSRMHAGNGSA